MADSYLHTPPLGAALPTWGEKGQLNARILERLQETLDNAAESGINWKVGIEQEFRLDRGPNYDPDKIEALRTAIVGQLTTQKTLGADAISAVEKFNGSELLLYVMHERLIGGVEHNFGAQVLNGGYYESTGTFEIRTAPIDPIEAIERYHKMLAAIQEVSSEYGYHLEWGVSQTSFSAWKDGSNLLWLNDHKEEARALNKGMMDAVYDNLVNIGDEQYFQRRAPALPISVGPSRSDMLRFVNNEEETARTELRTVMYPENTHLANVMLTVIGGAMQGLDHPPAQESESVYRGHFKSTRPKTAVLIVLRDAIMDEEDHLHISTRTVARMANTLSRELHAMFSENIEHFLNSTRIEKNNTIRWGDLDSVTDFSETITKELLDTISYHGKTETMVLTSNPSITDREQASRFFEESKLMQAIYGEELHAQLSAQRQSGIRNKDEWEVQGKPNRTAGSLPDL